MSRKKKKKKVRGGQKEKAPAVGRSSRGAVNSGAETAAGQTPDSAGPGIDNKPLGKAMADVKGLISEGRHKQAVERAKQLYGYEKTAGTENLLIDAYLARIEGMLDRNMLREANDLMDLVGDRFPAARNRLEYPRRVGWARSGAIDRLVEPLADPDLPAEERKLIGDVIRCEATDLSLLAECTALPLEHPLRRGAGAILEALTVACSGPVTDDDIALDEVSRKSPLAPWKMLVRAIAEFYRHDDEACLKCLEAVASGSAPARLVPLINGLVAGKIEEKPAGRRQNLVDGVTGRLGNLHKILDALDRNLKGVNLTNVVKKTREAVSECQQIFPEFLERLKQHISVKAFYEEFPEKSLKSAMGGPSLKNADFWRLFALLQERTGSLLLALVAWEEFRLHALHEGWFDSDSIEEGVLYLYMATLLHDISIEPDFIGERSLFIQDYPGIDRFYTDQPAEIKEAVGPGKRGRQDFYYFYPEKLYRRACAIGPAEDIYPRWMDYARLADGAKAVDLVAEEWHKAAPGDARPLLHLMESAENRKAFNKALKYLEAAEGLDGLNPEVKRGRLRLLTSCAKRHISQKKPHLLEKDLAEIEALTQVSEGDRPALVSGLKWAGSVIRSDRRSEEQFCQEVTTQLQDESAAFALLSSLAGACKITSENLSLPKKKGALNGAALIDSIARACLLGEDVNIDITIPPILRGPLVDALSDESVRGTAVQYLALAEAALRHDDHDLAYAASGAGLASGGFTEARFLLLRARCLPAYPPGRMTMCLKAAAELARTQGEHDLLEEAVDLLRPGRGGLPIWMWDSIRDEMKISPEEVEKILGFEKDMRDYKMRLKGQTQFSKVFGDYLYYYDPWDDEDEPERDDFPIGPDDFPDDDWDDDDEEYWDDGQMELFPDPSIMLAAVMVELAEAFPNHDSMPTPEFIERKRPDLAKKLNIALDAYYELHGKLPDFEDILEELNSVAPKKSGKRRSGRKKGGKKQRR